ncbi:MAG: hypothetical protein STHCBS139747_006745 [Sporothrix thermara]
MDENSSALAAHADTAPAGSISADPHGPAEWDINTVLPQDAPPWYKQRHLLLLNLLIVIPYFSSTTNGYDGSMLNGLQSMDHGSLLLVLGAALQCTAQDYGMFLAARMIIGFGGLIAVEASPMFIAEQAYPTHRAVLTAYQLQQPVVPGGALLAAWVTARGDAASPLVDFEMKEIVAHIEAVAGVELDRGRTLEEIAVIVDGEAAFGGHIPDTKRFFGDDQV